MLSQIETGEPDHLSGCRECCFQCQWSCLYIPNRLAKGAPETILRVSGYTMMVGLWYEWQAHMFFSRINQRSSWGRGSGNLDFGVGHRQNRWTRPEVRERPCGSNFQDLFLEMCRNKDRSRSHEHYHKASHFSLLGASAHCSECSSREHGCCQSRKCAREVRART